MPSIFIVEDDDNIRDLVLYALKNNFSTQGFADSAEFWPAVKNSLPDLVVLDIMLPGEDGITMLKSLKSNKRTRDLPVIMLTAKNSEYDRVKGLDSGADDYVTKPFSVLELMSRINAVLRRSEPHGDALVLHIKNVTLDAEKHVVTVDGQQVSLTYKEFELLQLLMENPDIVLSREKILFNVWDVHFDSETRTVDMHIKTLRRKLGDGGGIIHTVRGIGYKAGE